MTSDAQNDTDLSKYWHSETFNELSSPHIVAWKLARSAVEHENSLVNHRMTWFLLSQAFLFSAFVGVFSAPQTAMANLEPLRQFLLAAVGLFAVYVCLVTHDGLYRAFVALNNVTDGYESLIRRHGSDPIVPRNLHYWVKPKLIHQQKLPFATLLLWIALLVTCLDADLRSALGKFGTTGALAVVAGASLFALGYVLRGSRFFRHTSRP
jgi:hypothetical protein